MTTDLDDLKDLVATLKADRQAQKEKEKRDSWTRFVSLSTIVIAVLAAIATQRGAGFSSATMKALNEATYNQANASDQWAYYQAKGIKQGVAGEERDLLVAMGRADSTQVADLTKKVARYEGEQKDITEKAHGYEHARDDARAAATRAATRSGAMGDATTLFQIAIALGGITLIVKKRWLWNVSLLAGALATFQMARVLWWM